MAYRGPAQKTVKHGHTPTADWVDVVDEPYLGPSPDLPVLKGRRRWNPLVVEWWAEVRVMPHCQLWGATDWRFALETALLKNAFWVDYDAGQAKGNAATEIRRREGLMGTTMEARRQLRIRYLPPDGALDNVAGGDGVDPPATGVTSLQERRRRLTG